MFLIYPLHRKTYHNVCWILSSAFFASIEIIMIFNLVLLMWYNTLICSFYLCISGIKLIWSWHMILLVHCWIQFGICRELLPKDPGIPKPMNTLNSSTHWCSRMNTGICMYLWASHPSVHCCLNLPMWNRYRGLQT